MSLESIIPMVNRWLEGVNIAMDDDPSDRGIEDDDNLRESDSPTSKTRRAQFLFQCQRKKALFGAKYGRKYLDVNQNEEEDDDDLEKSGNSKRSYSSDDLSRAFHNPELLSSQDFLACNFSHRESIDSTYVQRPFSPSPSLLSSEQVSLCEEDIVLLTPQFGRVLSQRRASDGMLLPHVNSLMSDCDGRSSRSSRQSSRYYIRPTTPASSLKNQKSNSSLRLPPISINGPGQVPGELPPPVFSDNCTTPSYHSGSSNESFNDEQNVFPTPPQTPRSIESPTSRTCPQPLLARRRGSLPNVLAPVKRSGLPSVIEENATDSDSSRIMPFPPSNIPPANTVRRQRYRSKSLPNASLVGSLSDWQKFKARQTESGENISENLLNLPGIAALNERS